MHKQRFVVEVVSEKPLAGYRTRSILQELLNKITNKKHNMPDAKVFISDMERSQAMAFDLINLLRQEISDEVSNVVHDHYIEKH